MLLAIVIAIIGNVIIVSSLLAGHRSKRTLSINSLINHILYLGGHRQPTARPRVNSTLGHTSSFTSADKPPHLQKDNMASFRRHTITSAAFGKVRIS